MTFAIYGNLPVEPEAQFSLLCILYIRFSKIAFGKAHIIDGIQQIRLTTAVFTAKTGYISRKGKGGLPVIPELC
jgi:hypothetical protein